MPTKTNPDLEREYYEAYSAAAATTILPKKDDHIVDSATGLAGAAVSATLAAVAGKRNFLVGFSVTATNPAAAVNGVVTVSGLGAVNLSFQFVETVAAGGLLVVTFPTPMAASADNIAIVVSLPAIATGGIGAVAVWGYRK